MGWEQAWLDYDAISHGKHLIKKIFYNKESNRIRAAISELRRYQLDIESNYVEDLKAISEDNSILLEISDRDEAVRAYGSEGYEINVSAEVGGCDQCIVTVTAATDRGILYGVFGLIRSMRTQKNPTSWRGISRPSNPNRMLNHWDNSDGSIERGYSGRSFFFKNDELIIDERSKDYARLLASVGINGVVINNVNVAGMATWLISDRYYEPLNKLMKLFDAYGIQLYLGLNYAACIEIGGLSSADPLDQQVADWWQERMAQVYEALPLLGGFLIKADSEGRPGPFTYGRTHADGANMLARAVAPFNGLIIWRCFVYNCQQDWRDYVTDRARSGYDHFMPLDGAFEDNVVLQIKNGPVDFQVREPISPLLGAMKHTNQILEFQIAQEYTGQQRHICYLVPMWKEVLEFDTHHVSDGGSIKEIVSGSTYNRKHGGIAAVANTGDDENWTGHDLAAANLYGYGRLTWDTSLSSEAIAREWIGQTFGLTETLMIKIERILMMSWPAYEKYTSPLGIGWMVNPNHHYGPNVDGYEYDRWGTYHRADHLGMGVDRTRSGTAYCGQYASYNADVYGNLETCPRELLLFFHHVPYAYPLKSGKTLIQHIYDSHFEGALDVEEMARLWQEIEPDVDERRFQRVWQRIEHQLEHSKEWRDVVNTYFYRKSGIRDEKGRKIYE